MEILGDFVCTKYNYILSKLKVQKETGEYMLKMSKKVTNKSGVDTKQVQSGGSYQK